MYGVICYTKQFFDNRRVSILTYAIAQNVVLLIQTTRLKSSHPQAIAMMMKRLTEYHANKTSDNIYTYIYIM